jgi:hypothetical protein
LGITPLSAKAEGEDFELLDLRGEVVMTMDTAAGIPVELSGDRFFSRITAPLTRLYRRALPAARGFDDSFSMLYGGASY